MAVQREGEGENDSDDDKMIRTMFCVSEMLADLVSDGG